jgi:hypothetical protein|tara:strand:+ start:815 stop:1120 length:306 start_codon:yes stop_codon:yes gene_type:complete
MQLFSKFVKRKKDYKMLVGQKVMLFIKDINMLYIVNVLGSSKYLVRVEHYDGRIRKYGKNNVTILPYDSDTEEAINQSIESIKLETGVLQQLIDKRAYEFK